LDAQTRAFEATFFLKEGLTRRAGCRNNHSLGAIKSSRCHNFADCILRRWSRACVLALKHPELTPGDAEYVCSAVIAAANDPNVVESIRQQ